MLLNAFTMNCISHIQHGLWTREDSRQLDYTSLEPWIELAKLLERGCFDALFLADVIGVYDTYRGGPETSIREAMQIPVNDPAMLIPAMAYATEHLGFAFTGSVLQTPPFTFARTLSTLDHLTQGRVAWNVVTSYLPNAGANLGFGTLPSHDERYDRGDEYLEVMYKLWEGSWEDDAVLADRTRGVYADPEKIHPIDHFGKYYQVAGPHLCEPSPQRTPLLFQAGSSDRGREFAARHAECMFVVGPKRNLQGEKGLIPDVLARAARYGRSAGDIRFFQGLCPVVGGTEAEAEAKRAEYLEQLSTEGSLAHVSGALGVDLSDIDPDVPLEELRSDSVRGIVRGLIDTAPAGTRTFRDLMRLQMAGQYLCGTPETIADRLEDWCDAGIDGFNLVYCVSPGSFVDFVDAVVPVLQARGRVQKSYSPGPLREKLFGRPRVPASHPAAAYRCTLSRR